MNLTHAVSDDSSFIVVDCGTLSGRAVNVWMGDGAEFSALHDAMHRREDIRRRAAAR